MEKTVSSKDAPERLTTLLREVSDQGVECPPNNGPLLK
jgi:hypothetical protein